MDHPTPPLSRDPLRFVVPRIISHTLSNGIRVRLVPSDAEDIISVTIGLEIGAVHDRIEGETTFTAKMLGRGTTRLTSEAFSDEVESRGCSITTGAGYDTTSITGIGLGIHTDAMLTLMAECLFTPRFDVAEIDRERQRRLTDLLMSADDPEYLAVWASMAATYHRHAYGRSRDGNPQTLEQIDADVMRGVHARILSAPCAVVVAGPFDPDAMVHRLAQLLSPLPPATFDATVQDGTAWIGTAALAEKDDAVQSVIRVSLPAVAYGHPDMPALSLATSTLGGYPLARLFTILREQKGYTYGAYAYPDLRLYGRSTVIGTSVGNEYTRDTLVTLHDELRRIATEPLGAEEMENARQYMLGSFARSNETPQQTASLAWTMLQFGLADDHFQRYVERLQELTIDDCMAAQRTYLDPTHWCMGLAGNGDVLRNAVDGLVERVVRMDVSTRNLHDA